MALARLHLDFYDVSYETNGVPGDTFKGRWSGDLTRFDVKAGAVPRAFGPNYSVLFYENIGHFIMEDAPELLDAVLAVFADGGTDYPAEITR